MGKNDLSRRNPEQRKARQKPPFAARIPGFLLVWTVILFALAVAVYSSAGNGEQLARDMLRYAPPETTGLPEPEYEGVGQMTAGYLTGQETVFQYTFSDRTGNTYACFQPHEADHMADCRALIMLTGLLRWIFGAAALLFAGMGIKLRRQRKTFATGMLRGLAAAGMVFFLLTVWAMIDFDGFFTAFHRVAFTNEGWLLDSRTDLLIRLMPIEFFVAQALRVLVWTAAAALAALGAAKLIQKDNRPQGLKNDGF